MGMDQALTNKGFLGFMATILGLTVALQVAWRLGAARAEEESGRLEAVLACAGDPAALAGGPCRAGRRRARS